MFWLVTGTQLLEHRIVQCKQAIRFWMVPFSAYTTASWMKATHIWIVSAYLDKV